MLCTAAINTYLNYSKNVEDISMKYSEKWIGFINSVLNLTKITQIQTI